MARTRPTVGRWIGAVLLTLCALGILAWGEYSVYQTHRGMDASRAAVVNVPPSPLDPARVGKLVHVTGRTHSEVGVDDSVFGLHVDGLALKRTVEMYQWRERKETTGSKKNRRTHYYYEQEWSQQPISSGGFHNPTGHTNPREFPVRSETRKAADAKLGDFYLDSQQIERIGSWFMVDTSTLEREGWTPVPNGLVSAGANPAQPQVGDMRVSFRQLKPSEVTVLGEQTVNAFKPWTSSNGTTIYLIEGGARTTEQMLVNFDEDQSGILWGTRGFGTFVLWVASTMIIGPWFSLLLAPAVAGAVVLVGQLFEQPLLGGALLATLTGCFLLWRQWRASRSVAPAPPRGAYIAGPPPGPPPPPPPPPR